MIGEAAPSIRGRAAVPDTRAPEPGFRRVENPLAGALADLPRPSAEALSFHQRLPGYAPTPLLSIPRLAAKLGLGELLVKVEAARFGLPAFKMLGASWAAHRSLARALSEEFGVTVDGWHDLDELALRLEPLRPLTLVAATDGNHGRAVARMARLLRLDARIFVPRGTTTRRIESIASEGADVEVVDGGYDDAVARSAAVAGPRSLVVSDTSWPGYTDVPRWVIEGYETLFREVDDALGASGRDRPGVVVVPVGVGALAAAAVAHYRGHEGAAPWIVGVEPIEAACVTESALAGDLVKLDGEQHSIMAGLNCGTPSEVAWPYVSKGVDTFVVIDDEWARRGVRELAASGVEAGETGAAAYGGLEALVTHGGDSEPGGRLPPDASVLVLVTEGPTDPVAWFEILGVEIVGSS